MNSLSVNGTFSKENVEVFEIEAYGAELRIYASVISQKEQTGVNFVRSKLSCITMLPLSPDKVKFGDLILILTATGDLEHCICRAQITDMKSSDKGVVKVLLVDEGRWNVSVPLEQLYFCPPHLHIKIVPPLYEMFLLADVPPLVSWNPQLIQNLKSKLQRKLIPSVVNRDEKNNFICPLNKDSGQPLIMELFTAGGHARLLPSFPEITQNFASLPELPYRPWHDQNQLGTMMPFTPYSNFCQISQLPINSYGPSSNFFFPQITGTKGFNIPPTYFSQITGDYPVEFPNSDINSQVNYNTTNLPKTKKSCYSAERFTAGTIMKGKVSFIVKGPWKFYIQFDNQRRQLNVLKEQLNKFKYTKHPGEIKQAFQLVVRVLGEFYRALALQDESYGKIEVLFVDSGHIEYVDTSEVFLFPESLNSFSFLVTRCKLSGLSKNYDEYVSAKFAKLSLSSDPVNVEIVDPPHGIHQDHLVEVNISMKGHSVLEMLIGYRNEVLVNGAKVFISHVCQEDEVIYLQDSRKAEQIESMQIVLQDNAKTAEFQDMESLNVHDVCIAMLPSNQNWYRAKILRTGLVTKVQGCLQQNIQVYFVDYGNCAWVSYRQIRQIEPALQELMSAQAMPTIFKDLDLTNKPYNHVIKLLKSRVWKVNIGALLQKKLLYSSLKTVAQVDISDAVSGININQVVDWKFSALQTDKTSERVIPLRQDDAEPPQIQLYMDSLKLCRITSAQTPKCFFVTLVENDTIAQELFSKLNNRCEESKFVSGKHGQIVAVCSSDQNWHRALVTRNYGECVELFLIDSGSKMKTSVSELRELPYEHCLRSFPAQAIKCALDLDEVALENPRFKESFRSQALGQLQNVHFKEKEHNSWKVEFVEKMDAPKVLVLMKEMAKANISSNGSANLKASACLTESTTATTKKPQTLCSSKDNTTERDKKVLGSFDAAISSASSTLNKPILPKQHWKDMIINNLPAEVVAKHKNNNALKKMSDASSDVYLATKLSSCQATEQQIETSHSRNSPNTSTDLPAEIKINKENIPKCSVTNARDDNVHIGSRLRSQNTFRLGSMIEKSIKNEQNASFRGSSVKKSTENDGQEFKTESFKEYATVPIIINQCDMHYLQQNIELYKVVKLVVTWVESPVKYFCRLKDTNTEIFDVRMKEAQLEYNKLRAMENTKLKSFSKYPLRSSVMAYHGMKQTWYRGTILEYASSSEVKVQFVDYGNTEIIPLHDVLPMNEKFIAGIPQRAVPIVVDDIDQAFLARLNVQLLRTQLENTVMECIFDKKLCSFEYQATSIQISGKDLKVYLSNTGIKLPKGLKEIMENSEKNGHYERYTHTNFSSASIFAKKSGREGSIDGRRIKKDELPKGHPIQVYVSHVDKDKSFWVQQLDGVKKLNDMMEKLQIMMNDNESKSKSKFSTPTVHQYCTCKFSEDNTWYRGKIIEISEAPHVNVQYIDYGNSEMLEIMDIHELPHEFIKLPEQAIHCCLPEFPNYNKEKMMILNSLIKENEILSILSYEVFDDMNILYEVSNKEVNEIPKFLVNFPPNSSISGSDDIIGNNSNSFNSTTTPDETDSALSGILKTTCEHLTSEDLITVPLMAKDMNRAAPLLCESVVYITHIEAAAGRVWLQRAEDTEILTTLEGDIENSVTSMQVVDAPVVGLICLGKSCEDGIWYRAKVMEVFVASVLVYYMDYGNTEILHNSQCTTIPKQLGHQRSLAYSCIINVEEKQYVEAMKILQQYLDQELIINLHGESNDSYIISLLSGQENVLKDLQELLKKQDDDSHTKDTDIVSQKTVILHSTHLKKSCKMEKKNPLTISLCLVTVSYVETNGGVWIQCVDSSEALAVLMDSLHEYMNSTTAVLLKDPEVDEACVCLYSQDNSWYRGRVVNVNPTTITVLYSDYGNVEIMEPCKVYNMPQTFLSLPEQAVKCEVPDYCKEFSKNWLEKDCLASVSVYDNQPFISFLKLGELQYIPQDTIKTIRSDKLDQESSSNENRSFFTSADESTWNKTLSTNLEDTQIEANGKYCKQVLKKQDPIAINLSQVLISHFERDGSLWFRPIDSDSALVTLMDSIHEYTQTATLTSVNNPVEGSACLCCYSEDNEWYRARVLKISSNPPEITVLYVDYGNTQTLDSSKLFSLPKDFYSLPEQAIRCTIPDYSNEHAEQWVDQIGKVSVSIHESVPYLSFLQIGELVYIPNNSKKSKNIILSDSDNESKHSECTIISEDVEYEKNNKDLATGYDIVATNSSNTSTEGKFNHGNFVITLLDEKDPSSTYSNTEAINDAAVENSPYDSTVIQNLSLHEKHELAVDESIWNKTEITFKKDKENNEIINIEVMDLQKNNSASSSADIFNVNDQVSRINLESTENFIAKENSQNSENISSISNDTLLSPSCSIKSLGDESLNDKSNKSVIFIPNHDKTCNKSSSNIIECCILKKQTPSEISADSASISYIECNGSLWIQQICLEDLSALMDSLQNHMKETPIKTDLPTIGEIYVCQYRKDHYWYRARVVEVNTDPQIITVIYVDYGIQDTVEPVKLFKLPEEFSSLSEQTIECEIPDFCKVQSTSWIEENCVVSLTVKDGNSIVSNLRKLDSLYSPQNNKFAFVDRDIHEMGGLSLNNSILECTEASERSFSISETCTLSDSIDLKEISSNETNPFNPNYFSSEIPDSLTDESLWNKTVSLNLVENSVISKKLESSSYSNVTERENVNKRAMEETYKCVSASILFVDGNIVWIQLHEYSRLFDALMDDLHAHMEESIPSHISHPSNGDACVCRYTADNGWYRGRIVDGRNHDSMSVFYIDYGNAEIQKLSNIYKLPQKFKGFPQQAIKCRLPDVSNEPISHFINKKLNISLTKVGDDFVIQYFEFDNKEYILRKLNITHTTPDSISSHLITNNGDLIKQQDPTLINKSNMIITHVESNHSVWMQHTLSSESLDTLMNDLDNYMKESTPLLLEMPFIGQACVCQYSEDDGWYRARVFKITEGYTNVTVLFIDYGNVENVDHSNIFRIPVKFTILREQSVNCTFPAYFNSANENLINKECVVSVLETVGIPTISYFKLDGIEYISEHEMLATREENITVNKDQIKNTTWNNLHRENDIFKIGQRTLNAKNNIPLPIELSNDNAKEFEDRVLKMGSDVACNSTLGNAQSEGQQSAVECFDIKSSEVSHIYDGNNTNMKVLQETCGGSDMADVKNNNSDNSIKELEALSYSVESILKLIHIYNESDNTIWVNLYENQTVLKEMMGCLNGYMDNLSSKDGYKIIPKVGDICVAKYSKNGLWHRVKILEHSDDLSKMTVRYIDYGFKETFEGRDFYDLPQETFAILPHQAIHCCLELEHNDNHLDKIYNQDYFEGTFKSGHDLPILKIEVENFQQNKKPGSNNFDKASITKLDGHQDNTTECKSIKASSEIGELEDQNVCNQNDDLSFANIQESVKNTLHKELCLADGVDQILVDTLNLNSPTSNTSLEKYENISDSIESNNEEVDSLLSDTNQLDNLLQVEEVFPSEPEFSCEPNRFCSVEPKTLNMEKPGLAEKLDYNDEKIYSSSMMEGNPNIVGTEDVMDASEAQQFEAFCALLVHIEESPFCLWVQEEENLDTVDFIDSSLEQIRMKCEYVDDPEVNNMYAATLSAAPLRVIVKQVERGEAFVHFIDQGKKSWVSISRIFRIPTFLSEIKPLAKSCYLPVTIIPGRQSGAVLAMAETVLKKICVCVHIKKWYSEWGPGNLMLMSSPLIGSLSAFLADHELAKEDDWKTCVGLDAANIIESNLNAAVLQVTKTGGQEQNSSLLDNTLFVTADEDLAQRLKELSFVSKD